jgi:hypothetical protein
VGTITARVETPATAWAFILASRWPRAGLALASRWLGWPRAGLALTSR